MKYANQIKNGLTGVAGIVVPGASYFTENAPPMWPALSALAGIVASLVVVIVFHLQNSKKNQEFSRENITWIVVSLAAALILGFTYTFAFDRTTADPGNDFRIVQIGFGTWNSDWNLTENAQKYLRENPDAHQSNHKLMFNCEGYEDVTNVYRPLALYLAGLILLVLLVAGTVTWTLGVAIVASIAFPPDANA